MLALYQTLSLRYLRRRRVRTALIVASIALGVAALVATRSLNETMAKAALASSNPFAGVVDLILSNGELPVDKALAADVARVPGVKSAQARVFGAAKLTAGAFKGDILVLGIDVARVAEDLGAQQHHITLSDGVEAQALAALALFQTPVVVGLELDKLLPANVMRVTVQSGPKAFPLVRVGTVRATGDLAALGGHTLLLDMTAAAKVLGLPAGQVSRLDVVLDPDADAQATRAAVREVVRGRAQVRTPAEQNQALQSAMAGMRTGFAMGGLATLIVGMFLVYNALSVSVAERRHEIGILLAVGATRAQVALLFTGEALILGVLGSLLGLPLGVGLAYLGLQPMQDILSDVFSSMHARQVEISPELAVLAVLAGTIAATLASLLPALVAMRERPAEAVRRVAKAATLHGLFVQVAVSAGLIVGGGLLILIRDYVPARFGTFWGMGLILVGALVASPLIAALTARLIQPFARRWFPFAWRLAADNLVRSPGRTGMVIGALAAGVALVMQTAGLIRSNRDALRTWIQESIAADLIVTAGSPVGSGGQSTPMDETVGVALRQFPEVEAALPVRFCKVALGAEEVAIMTSDAGRAYPIEKRRQVKGAEVELLRVLDEQPNTVVVSDNFLPLHRLQIGDPILLPTAQGAVSFKIVGTIVDYSWPRGTIIMHRRDYLAHWNDPRVDVFDVYLSPGSDPVAVKEKVASQLGAQHNLQPLTRAELQEHIDGIIERFYGIAYAQQIVVMLVAALGVVTALLISVLQRRREMGLLRAIGASQVQVIHTVLAEACLMGILGTVIGILVGIPLQWYVLNVVILEEAGFLFPLSIPWSAGIVIGIVAMTTATAAGLGPALYAVRQRIPEAIAYE